jgi:hypothetical protein
MYGEFKCDASRATFDQNEHFIRVVAQQGRVWLDADWNEQTAILLHYIQALAADVIGPRGGPAKSFEVTKKGDKDLSIGIGHYYVDGILCENDVKTDYSTQDDYPLPDEEMISKILESIPVSVTNYLVYLDVWERHVTYIQDRDKYRSIREVALGEADTATRSKLIWQVKLRQSSDNCEFSNIETVKINWDTLVKNCFQHDYRGLLSAIAKESEDVEPECALAAEAKYRGEGNQLYRVEIHNGGKAWKEGEVEFATFKWSRENGSVAFPLKARPEVSEMPDGKKETMVVVLENLRCCNHPCLSENDLVEVVDDVLALQNRAEPLWQVKSIDSIDMKVTLERNKTQSSSYHQFELSKHPLLRRWDQKGDIEENDSKKEPAIINGAIPIVESIEENEVWISLEKGIKVQFKGGNPDHEIVYRTGDYWLIPARTATGDVEWPKTNNIPDSLTPHGINHHYAPLAIVSFKDGKIFSVGSCRTEFTSLINHKP